MVSYPISPAARTRWILEKRGPKRLLDPLRPYAFFSEAEPTAERPVAQTATLFLTNAECPYRCLMCDLWQDTLDAPTAAGAIPAQIRYALERLPACSQIKLYNSGSFFDPRAIPPEDYPEIAQLLKPFKRVIVECHPALVGRRCVEFRELIDARLEIAIGLETVNAEALKMLNKRFTVDDFLRASDFLASKSIDLRVFLLVKPPPMTEQEGVEWACRSLDVSFGAGATACSLIPVRAGNGAMEALQAAGEWSPPRVTSLEGAHEYGLGLNKGRVFADLWTLEKRHDCICTPARIARIAEMNRSQRIPPPILCAECETRADSRKQGADERTGL